MKRTKRVLSFRNLAAFLSVLLPFNVWATVGKKDSSATTSLEKRLVLSPQAYLQLTAEPIWGDSVEAVVTVAVPDSCKIQRYVCWFETNASVRFGTVPRYKWALRHDSLTVLSSMPLQIRVARQSFASSPQSPVVKIHYQNLDHAAKLSGTATLDLKLDQKLAHAIPLKTDSNVASRPVADSSQMKQPLPAMTSSSGIDSTTAATGSSSFGIFYLALAILLIFLFGGLGWLMTWSQRRRLPKSEAKTTAMAFPHLQHRQPSTSAVATHTVNEPTPQASHLSESLEAPAPISPSPDLPAAASHASHFNFSTVLVELHELNMNLQQIIANQQEANQRLAQMAAAAALEAPKISTQLALFDILNEEAGTKKGEGRANSNGSSSHLRIQFAGDRSTDSLSVNLASSTPVHIELENKRNNNERVGLNLGSSSNLRILFANTESNSEASDEVLLH